jgi:hypothetical protein
MTAIMPTALSMKLKFPEFRLQDDAVLELDIEEARVSAGNQYVDDANQSLATVYLAAHYTMVRVSRAESGTGQVVKSESFGPMSITYDTASQPVNLDPSDFASTPYGLRYMELVKLNVGGPMVI